MGPKLSKQPLSASTEWVVPGEEYTDFSKQLREVSKLIQISKTEKFVEVRNNSICHCAARTLKPFIACLSDWPLQRSGFVTIVKGWDTHNSYREQVNLGFQTIDTALKNFVTEMKAQGIWDDVVIMTMSDFGRKLTPNGRGTDHAWGGIRRIRL